MANFIEKDNLLDALSYMLAKLKPYLPTASDSAPLMDASKAKSGTSSKYSRADHVHPQDADLAAAIQILSTTVASMHNPYPVGAIYISVDSTDPSTLFGGTWERIEDTFLLAAGSTYAAGSTGGEATHKLTVNEMPEHWHQLRFAGNTAEIWQLSTKFQSGSASQIISYGTGRAGVDITGSGGSAAHNNMPPYLAVYVWRRTA